MGPNDKVVVLIYYNVLKKMGPDMGVYPCVLLGKSRTSGMGDIKDINMFILLIME